MSIGLIWLFSIDFFSIFESRIKYKYFKKVEKQEQTHVNSIAVHYWY